MRLRRFASVALASALVAFLIAGCASFPERSPQEKQDWWNCTRACSREYPDIHIYVRRVRCDWREELME